MQCGKTWLISKSGEIIFTRGLGNLTNHLLTEPLSRMQDEESLLRIIGSEMEVLDLLGSALAVTLSFGRSGREIMG